MTFIQNKQVTDIFFMFLHPRTLNQYDDLTLMHFFFYQTHPCKNKKICLFLFILIEAKFAKLKWLSSKTNEVRYFFFVFLHPPQAH